jgi:hypothetical protein
VKVTHNRQFIRLSGGKYILSHAFQSLPFIFFIPKNIKLRTLAEFTLYAWREDRERERERESERGGWRWKGGRVCISTRSNK